MNFVKSLEKNSSFDHIIDIFAPLLMEALQYFYKI